MPTTASPWYVDFNAEDGPLIAALYRGGLRVSEALAFYLKDLDPASVAVPVPQGKRGRVRAIGPEPWAFRLVEVWARHRADLGLDACQPLVCIRRGRPITSLYIRRLLSRLSELAGI